MKDIDNPNYYSILPAGVRYDHELTSLEKLLYSEITALCDKTGSCWASNNYFANLFHKTPSTISRNIKKLEKKEYIKILYKRKGSQIIERAISILKNSPFSNDKNINGTSDKNINGTSDKNDKENTTSINNINKNNINIIFTKENSNKLTYGKFNNVSLLEEEYEKLKQQFSNYLEKIENLSEYIESTGKNYKSHYATILCWNRKENLNSKKDNKSNYRKAMEMIDSL